MSAGRAQTRSIVEKVDHAGSTVDALEPAIRFFIDGRGGTERRRGEKGRAFGWHPQGRPQTIPAARAPARR